MCGDYWVWLNSGGLFISRGGFRNGINSSGLFVGRGDLLLRVSIILRIGLRYNWRVVVLR